MRISVVLSLLVHTAAGATAWWLLARPQAEVAVSMLHIRQTTLLPPEPRPPQVPASPRPSLPDEPIDAAAAVEPELEHDFELDEQAVIELRPQWAPTRHAPLTRPLRLRPRARPAPPSAAAPAPQKAVRAKRPVRAVLVSARPIKGRMPAARYPSRALRLGLTGTVRLRARVGADGRVARVEIVASSGSKLLDRAATDALKLWHFSPARRDGKPAAQWVRVPFRFQLRSES